MAIPSPAPHIAAFEQFGYGLFLHWGLYSQIGQGEWIMSQQRIPHAEYRKLADTFTAEDFDGRAIARTARRAGMRYITLTTRHHDGFSLYDTKGLNDFDAPHSAAGRDLIAEFVAGCRAEDIVPVFYHTTLDWSRPEFTDDFPAYLAYLRDSVEILCTNYGEIGGLWFDGNWSKRDADWEEDALYGMIRSHQPNAMIINNTGLGNCGALGHPELDSITFEQGRPEALNREGMSKYVAVEMCQTMNGHWGIGAADFRYQSPKEVIENLAACRRVGANYLLNVGPTASGAIPDYERACLERVGDWVSRYDECLRCARPHPAKAQHASDFVLAHPDGRLFVFVHDLGVQGSADVVVRGGRGGAMALSGIDRPIKRVRWLGNDEDMSFSHDADTGLLVFKATGYPYGVHHVVRVAELS
ncbi:MAG: alpha-L-fucosidase [Planctomycetota bacterium]|jgi:alpha-L-fucosidase|nr:alpha-L-fucosidase [Planctomycetota bacterium]